MSVNIYGAADRAFALVPTAVQTTGYAANANDLVVADTTSGALTVTLPTAPADRTVIGVKVVNGAYAVTVACGAGATFNRAGGPTSLSMSLPFQGLLLQYASSAGVWYAVGDDLPLAQLDLRYAVMINARVYGATGDGVTDDTAAINAALAAAGAQGGGIVYLPWGNYLVSAPLTPPPYTYLQGLTAVTLNLNTPPGTVSRIIASASWAPSSSTGIISFLSKTPGGWSSNTAACGLRNLYIDGSLNSSTNLNGINMVGPVYDLHLEDVFIYKAPHNGITASGQSESGITPTFPYHHRYTRVTIANAANTGFNLVNFTDSTFENCMGFANVGNNWALQNNSNSVLTACRGEWSTSGRGFNITGSAGSILLDGCTSDQNAAEGIRITAATGQSVQGGGVVITGGKLHADGWGGTNNNGIKVTGSTVPVTITGLNIESGQNVNNSGFYPATALEIDTSSNVIISSSILQGITSAWVDGGGNTSIKRRGCLGMTGNPNTQTVVAMPDLPYAPVPVPADLGMLAWNYDPVTAGSGTATTSGTLYVLGVPVREQLSVTNVELYLSTLGASLTSGQNLVALFNSSGTQIGVSADQTSAWQTGGTTGPKIIPLVGGPYTLPAGLYYVAVLTVGSSTMPAFLRGGLVNTAGAADGGHLTAANFRFATNGTSLSAMPSSLTLSSNSHTGAQQYWTALS